MQPSTEPHLPLEHLLPLRAVVVTLECLSETHTAFFHQPALHAYLRYLAGSPEEFSDYIRLDTCESGRIHYRRGDLYRFLLIALGGGEAILDRLLHALSRLPASAAKAEPELAFRDNWRVHALQDAFTEEPATSLEQLAAYGSDSLAEETALWLPHERFDLRWTAPARLLKEKQRRIALKGEARFCRGADDTPAGLLLTRLYDAFADLLRRRDVALADRPAPPPGLDSDAHLFWLDVAYADRSGEAKPMGGMAGRVSFRCERLLSPAWWRLLVLGQYTGIGQRTGFGWGRYRLIADDGGFTSRRPLPAASMLTRAAGDDNLADAWRHVMTGADLPLDPEQGPTWDEEDETPADEDAVEAPLTRLRQDLERLFRGEYTPPELRGHLIPKSSGGVRPLAVPPVYDRVLQRAVAQALTPALERLMYRHSHGYRRGRSRLSARYDIQAAWRAGYRWVYESDIKDFFDSVDLERLRERLQAIYDDDPMVDAILAWMRAPVRFGGERIERRQGLPQGSPLSPLMANLMLDDFDSDMEQAGFHLIRFADDFIVLCKDPEQARAAGAAAAASLAEHGLALHPDKTRITAMDQGFRYLGYLFVNDLALDVGGKGGGAKAPPAPPPNSWLARLGEREPTRLHGTDAVERLVERLARQRPVSVGEREQSGALLAVTGDPAVLSTDNRNLQVHRGDKRLFRHPWRSLQAVLLFGNHQITTQAMKEALRHGVGVHLASGAGDYHGALCAGRGTQGHRLWLEQVATCRDPEKALYLAREVVGARLRHMKETLRQRHKAWDSSQLDQSLRNLHRPTDLAGLRGLEGSAAREYYRRIGELLPDELGFTGRNRRPPRDPFNVLLSLGYTLLYGYTDTVLRAVGLLPWQGFYHQPRGDHAALASDLLEPFRHLAERTALTLVLRHEVGPDDFTSSPAGACHIADPARRKFLALLLQNLEQPVKALGDEQPHNPIEHMHRQALALRRFITAGEAFTPWRIR